MNEKNSLLTVLDAGLNELGIKLSDIDQERLLFFISLLIKWNKVYNLTAIVQPEAIIQRHLLDSLSITPYIRGKKVLDVGSGAGLPGIPCALALPAQDFTLLDSNGKKTRFMTQAVAELQMKNVEVIQSRVEDYHPKQYFDTILVRAFSSIENILLQTRHLLCAGGELLIMKGIYPSAELQNINNHVKVHKLLVPGLNEQRHLVCIKGSLDG
ncbi:MAG: 16S rRNA (guanine(527)-N(7))-methyltransferase RsmG [Gammaproteobacteria bacterium]|nr:16S rRNA (guanine(527)-N(7))-methyltransferase RsmG [Gammaproteobacteria bacterium]